jgi:hypothetical protein
MKDQKDLATLDVRVRERMLRHGSLTQEVVEAHLANLKDVESEVEDVSIQQPALLPLDAQPSSRPVLARDARAQRAAAGAESANGIDEGDEDEDEDDEDEDEDEDDEDEEDEVGADE